ALSYKFFNLCFQPLTHIMYQDFFPTRRSSDLKRYEEEFNYRLEDEINQKLGNAIGVEGDVKTMKNKLSSDDGRAKLKEEFGLLRSEEHTSELQSRFDIV